MRLPAVPRCCCRLLDQVKGGNACASSLQQQRAKLRDASLTPSARVLAAIAEHDNSFFRFALAQSEAHNRYFRERPLDPEAQAAMADEAASSLAEQAALEEADTISFDRFVADYMAQSA